MTKPTDSTTLADLADFPAPEWFGEIIAECRDAMKFYRPGDPPREIPRRPRKTRAPVPGGLLTAKQAAQRLACSIKTLDAHRRAGDIKYVTIGHGTKRPRIAYAESDIAAFIVARTKEDSPCPSTAPSARRSTHPTSGSKVIAFTSQPRPPRSGKRKP